MSLVLRLHPVGFEACQPIGARNPPSGTGWIHEIKLDGFRMMAQRRAVGGSQLPRCNSKGDRGDPDRDAEQYDLWMVQQHIAMPL
jgi:hypothetical protein